MCNQVSMKEKDGKSYEAGPPTEDQRIPQMLTYKLRYIKVIELIDKCLFH